MTDEKYKEMLEVVVVCNDQEELWDKIKDMDMEEELSVVEKDHTRLCASLFHSKDAWCLLIIGKDKKKEDGELYTKLRCYALRKTKFCGDDARDFYKRFIAEMADNMGIMYQEGASLEEIEAKVEAKKKQQPPGFDVKYLQGRDKPGNLGLN